MSLKSYKLFPKEEYEERWKKARKLMARKNIDALMVTSPINYVYFVGSSADMYGARQFFMILSMDHDPIQLVHAFSATAKRRESWFEVRSYDTLLGFPYDNKLKEIVEELGLSKSRIGAELGYEQRLGIPYNDFKKIEKQLSDVEFVDASDILWELRMIKSRAEIECHRKAVDISCKAVVKVFEEAKEGMTEREVVDMLMKEQKRPEGAMDAFVFVNSGSYNYESGCLIPGDYRLKRGNILWFDFGCNYKEHWSDLSAGVTMGKPLTKHMKMQENIVKITRNVITAIKPGMKASDLSKVADEEFKKIGQPLTDMWGRGDGAGPSTNRAGRIGHGIGMQATENPHIAKYDNTILRAGMIISMEPCVVTDYGHFHAEEDILITEDGYEVLSKIPRNLEV